MKQLKKLKYQHKAILRKKGLNWEEYGLKYEDNVTFTVAKKHPENDKDKKEYLVSNNNDYEQLSKLILNKETIEVKLISIRAIKKDYDGYIASDEDIDTIIEQLDEEYNVKDIFEDNIIRDAIIKSKGDINKAQEILFE